MREEREKMWKLRTREGEKSEEKKGFKNEGWKKDFHTRIASEIRKTIGGPER